MPTGGAPEPFAVALRIILRSRVALVRGRRGGASFAIDGAWSALDRSRHALIDYVTVKSLGDKD